MYKHQQNTSKIHRNSYKKTCTEQMHIITSKRVMCMTARDGKWSWWCFM